MGFLDKIKQQATDVAATVVEKTQETAKTGQLQMQLRSLRARRRRRSGLDRRRRSMIALGEDSCRAAPTRRPRCTSSRQGSATRRQRSRTVQRRRRLPRRRGDTVECEAEEVADTPPPPPQPTRTPPPAATADSPLGARGPADYGVWPRCSVWRLRAQHGLGHGRSLDQVAIARQLDADLAGRVRLRLQADQQQVDLVALERLLLEQRVRQHVQVPAVVRAPVAAPRCRRLSVISRCSWSRSRLVSSDSE